MEELRHRYFALLPLALSAHSGFCFNESINQTTGKDESGMQGYNVALVFIYSVVLLVGSIGVTLMTSVLKSNLHSWTTITFFNLILVHVIFLLTIPFRLYYYVTNYWSLSMPFCKLVSGMIHIHMHVVFVIYVVILTIQFLQHFKKIGQIEFNRSLHAIGFSIGIWSILIIICPVVLFHYGMSANKNETKCFHFASELKSGLVFQCNIFLSVSTVIVSCIISCTLAAILYTMIKKHGASSWAQQEFWAQMKNVSLVLIILFCLAPYHLYRLYYLNNADNLQLENEVFLAITSLTCFDMMLVFTGKGICHRCWG
ncbi:putative G-protein coupled receptor 141 [Silurus asotus]|uniref:G-protein coupled receptor 141 n=1 Tax=Silurus asotus TaxID=30991 RepID=A0AAD5FKL2_SILAS|nr:putative G-protein coupled receptor 141 [Silurus asotus]